MPKLAFVKDFLPHMKDFLKDSLRGLLLALWLGAAIFFSFAVARSAFAVLPSSDMAGAVVNKTLEIINYSGLAVGLFLLLTSFFSKESSLLLWVERILLLVLSLSCALGQFVISAWMHGIRQQVEKPISELPADDPLRIVFNELHNYSVALLSVAMIAAFIAYFLMVKKSRRIVE